MGKSVRRRRRRPTRHRRRTAASSPTVSNQSTRTVTWLAELTKCWPATLCPAKWCAVMPSARQQPTAIIIIFRPVWCSRRPLLPSWPVCIISTTTITTTMAAVRPTITHYLPQTLAKSIWISGISISTARPSVPNRRLVVATVRPCRPADGHLTRRPLQVFFSSFFFCCCPLHFFFLFPS